MSAANDIVKSRQSWLRRNSESPSGLKVVGDVPPDLANNIDEDGSLVTVDPADWIVCFVPGLRRQWWHRFVHNRHKHVFAMRPTGTGSWLLVEPWWTRMMVTILPPADAVRTPSGLASKVLTPGTGTRHPRPNSQVRVHYTGWTTDGKEFDSSVGGEPITFGVDGVIPGWTEGLQMMVEGEKRRFWIPAKLAYEGEPLKPQGTLVFDVELLRIES